MLTERETIETAYYVREALIHLCPQEDDNAINALLMAYHYLTGMDLEFTDLVYQDTE